MFKQGVLFFSLFKYNEIEKKNINLFDGLRKLSQELQEFLWIQGLSSLMMGREFSSLAKECSLLVPLFSSAFLFLVSEVSNLHLVEIFLLLHSLNSSRIIEIITLMR